VVAAVLALIAGGEAIGLARTGFTRTGTAVAPAPPVPVTIASEQPGDLVVVDGRDVGVTPMTLPLRPDMRSIHVLRTSPNPAVIPVHQRPSPIELSIQRPRPC